MFLFGSNDNGLTDMFIKSVLDKTCQLFEGCYSSDNIPLHLATRKEASIIVNLAPVKKPGSHFITIIIKPAVVFYIDSLGQTCTNSDIYNFMVKCQRRIVMSDLRVQHPLSSFCGFFCLAMCLYHDETRDFYLNYSENLHENDDLAVSYVSRMIKMKDTQM